MVFGKWVRPEEVSEVPDTHFVIGSITLGEPAGEPYESVIYRSDGKWWAVDDQCGGSFPTDPDFIMVLEKAPSS